MFELINKLLKKLHTEEFMDGVSLKKLHFWSIIKTLVLELATLFIRIF